MRHWPTIEVQDADVPASLWRARPGRDLHAGRRHQLCDPLNASPLELDEILEITFPDEARRDANWALPLVQPALDAVPDPVRGLYVYPGRGGGPLVPAPRARRRAPLTGAAAAEDASDEEHLELASSPSTDPVSNTQSLV